jgi:hypothetical protein
LFLNDRKIPEIVLEIDAILNRLPPYHPKRPLLEDERRSYLKGFYGEKQIDRYLKNLESDYYSIIRGIRLVYQSEAFQMDTLIVTRFFLLIIESKNIGGILEFEKDSKQVIRKLEGKIQGYKNPIIQVERQKNLLIRWLKKNGFPPIPVLDLVGIADRRTIITTTDDNRQIFQKLFHADCLVEKIKQFEAQYTTEKLNTRKLIKLNQLLLNEHTPAPPSILRKYQIDPSELSKGCQCPNCKNHPLVRQCYKWFCNRCKAYVKDAHKQGVFDYFLIIAHTFSSKQIREFLLTGSDSRYMIHKLLTRLNLPTSGANKNRLYHRPQDLTKIDT